MAPTGLYVGLSGGGSDGGGGSSSCGESPLGFPLAKGAGGMSERKPGGGGGYVTLMGEGEGYMLLG